MTQASDTAAISAARKMDQWFQTLSSDEQEVIGAMVHAAMTRAAERAAEGDVSGYAAPSYLDAFSGVTTPSIVQALHLPPAMPARNWPRS